METFRVIRYDFYPTHCRNIVGSKKVIWNECKNELENILFHGTIAFVMTVLYFLNVRWKNVFGQKEPGKGF